MMLIYQLQRRQPVSDGRKSDWTRVAAASLHQGVGSTALSE